MRPRPDPQRQDVWIENAWLVEILPPAYAAEYLAFAARVSGAANAATAMDAHFPEGAARAMEPA